MYLKIIVILLGFVSSLFCDDTITVIKPLLMQAQQLAFEHIQDRSKPIPVLAVAGCSAVGKSYFARLVASALRERGVSVFVLHQDDYLNLDQTFSGYKIHPNLDHDSLHDFFSCNRSGLKKMTKPCRVDKNHMKRKELSFERIDLIIFEGIYALTGPETYNFAQYATLGVFLDAQTTNIVKWHALRNKKRPFFARHGTSEIAQHATCLLYEYTRYILPSKKNAQFIVYKDDLNSYRFAV